MGKCKGGKLDPERAASMSVTHQRDRGMGEAHTEERWGQTTGEMGKACSDREHLGGWESKRGEE